MSTAREQLAAHALVDLADEYISGAHRDSTVAQRPEVLREFVKWVLARGVFSLRAPQGGPWTWDTAPAALKQIRADAMRLGKAGERIVLLVDTLIPRVQHVNEAGQGAETPPQPETEK